MSFVKDKEFNSSGEYKAPVTGRNLFRIHAVNSSWVMNARRELCEIHRPLADLAAKILGSGRERIPGTVRLIAGAQQFVIAEGSAGPQGVQGASPGCSRYFRSHHQ